MTHPVDEMQDQARVAILHMRVAALEARRLHARAELMRHMRGTAARLAGMALDAAAEKVAGEWMQAWGLGAGAYQALSADVGRFARAFCADVRGSDAASQAELRAAIAALDVGFAAHGLSVAEEMASRSECAHGWWGAVVPKAGAGTPFWTHGAPPRCGAEAI